MNDLDDREVKVNANDQDLRVKDIFLWKSVDYVIPYDGKERKLLMMLVDIAYQEL